MCEFQVHAGAAICVSVTPDGRRAVSGSWDRTVRVWNLDRGTCLAVEVVGAPAGAVALARGGSLICTGTSTGEFVCYDVRGGD